MAYDYSAHAVKIEAMLRQYRHELAAVAIEDAILGGATSTEILMALRHVLRGQLKTLKLPHSITTEMKALIYMIDKSGV